jgi:hypothetical protein
MGRAVSIKNQESRIKNGIVAAMRPILVVMLAGSVLLSDVTGAQSPPPQRVDITPAGAEAQVGQTLTFRAVGIDASGKPVDAAPSAWFAAPFDSAAADLSLPRVRSGWARS